MKESNCTLPSLNDLILFRSLWTLLNPHLAGKSHTNVIQTVNPKSHSFRQSKKCTLKFYCRSVRPEVFGSICTISSGTCASS